MSVTANLSHMNDDSLFMFLAADTPESQKMRELIGLHTKNYIKTITNFANGNLKYGPLTFEEETKEENTRRRLAKKRKAGNNVPLPNVLKEALKGQDKRQKSQEFTVLNWAKDKLNPWEQQYEKSVKNEERKKEERDRLQPSTSARWAGNKAGAIASAAIGIGAVGALHYAAT